MPGGHLAELDRAGREVKRFPLASGTAIIGRGDDCDIRVVQPAVSPHHATIAMQEDQAILRSLKSGTTLVNGHQVSIWRLKDGDMVSLAGTQLRWHEDQSPVKRPRVQTPQHILVHKKLRNVRSARRATTGGVGTPSRIKLELDALHRASTPTARAGGKQVAVVQPQRREAALDTGASSKTEDLRRASVPNLQTTTKATLWIESRKSSPRRRPAGRSPLRLAVLKKQAVLKIQDPRTIDQTKQAAIMLMTGHTPKPRSLSFIVQKPTSKKKSPNKQGRKLNRGSKVTNTPKTPKTPKTPLPAKTNRSSSVPATRSSKRGTAGQSVLEITDSDTPSTSRQNTLRKSRSSPQLGSPKKSAMKDPSAKRNSRKTESIKFDLSNLENQEEDLLMLTDTRNVTSDSVSDSDLTLHYSDSSSVKSPSPRKSIHSRSSRILEKTLGSPMTEYNQTRTLTPVSPSARKSLRGSLIVQKALDKSKEDDLKDSKRNTKSITKDTNGSPFRTRTLSPRKSNIESYSIVDLVSMDSNLTGKTSSIYNSADSVNSSVLTFGTPSERKSTRSSRSTIIGASLLGSSTPYIAKQNRSKRSNSNPNISNINANTTRMSTRRSKSVTTPENKHISVNSTRISRASKYLSRINDSDLLLISSQFDENEDSSPKTSKRASKSDKSIVQKSPRPSSRTITLNDSELDNSGLVTPENRQSPVEVGTPVLSIQSLLNSSQSSINSNRSFGKRRNVSKRKTIATISHIEAKKAKNASFKSTSLYMPARKSLRLSSDESPPPDDEIVTPKSSVKLIQEAVKNKHSTAKKPQSKRSIIDDLNASDIVKQLFSSPVKRKLSQSMTEFSRKHLNGEEKASKKPTRKTIALTRRTLDNSLQDNSIDLSLEAVVSPLSTPSKSPILSTSKRSLRNNTLENERNITAVKTVRSPRTRKSVNNDLTNVYGLKKLFRKSPKNRISDVQGVKKMFAPSPKNDLRRVTGVKTLFKKQKSPKNDLSDVRGVKALFTHTRSSPRSDYRNVSGVKATFAKGPKNDLSDLRGVKNMYGRKKRQTDYDNVSGVEDLFNESFNTPHGTSTDNIFDQLLGKPTFKAVYSKSFTKNQPKTKTRSAKSLHASIDVNIDNVEKWLENELKKRTHKDEGKLSRKSRELAKLATDTVEGIAPIRKSRSRNSTMMTSLVDAATRKLSASDVYSAHTLPIKKRSIVEKSLETSANKSRRLPIKKRAVVHSTPVKGRYNLTMNASELGRVSPIVADKTKHDTSITVQIESKSPKPKTPKGRRATKQVPQTIAETAEPPANISPKKTRGKAAEKASPEIKRVTRTRKATKQDETVSNTKKRRTSLVIVKKSPVAKPKATKTKQNSTKQSDASPKKTRNTRLKQDTETTPKKNTRAKIRRSSVIVTKPSPKMKPQTTRGKKTVANTETIQPTTRKKPTKVESTETTKPTTRRGRKTADDVTSPKTKRGKAEPVQKVIATRTNPASKKENVEVATKRGGRNAKLEVKEAPKPKRGQNKTAPTETNLSKRSTRQPKNKQTAKQSPKKIEPKTRGKKLESQPSTQSEPTTARGRKTTENKNKTTENNKTTRNNNKAENKTTEPVGRKRGAKVDEKPTPKKLAKSKSEETQKITRGRKNEEVNKTQVATRRKRNETDAPIRGRKVVVEAEKPQRTGRKRKSEDTPKDIKKQPAKKSRKTVETTSPANKRTTRAKATTEAVKPATTRTRRR